MIYTRIASDQPGTGAANTLRVSPGWGKLPLRLFAALIAAVLVATMIPTAAPVYAEATIITPPPNLILVSSSANGTINLPGGLRLSFHDEDILSYDPSADIWAMYFDGSSHGLNNDLKDFEVLSDGDILFTLDKPVNITPLGIVDDSDVVRYDLETGTFSLFLEGSDIGLTKGDEDIDAFACEDPDCSSRLLISTTGTARANAGGLGEVEAKDEDLLACDPITLACELFFDGSDVDLLSGSEDVDAAWLNTLLCDDCDWDGGLWLSTKGNFFAEGSNPLGGDSDDIFGCAPDPALGADTDCFFYEVFNGDAVGLSKNIDGLWVTYGDRPPPQDNVVAADSQTADVVEADDAIDASDFAEAMSLGDPEIDAYDFIDVVQQIYLPLMNR